MARLNFPNNFLLQRQLFGTIESKDTADGAGSVIRPFMTEETIVLADDDADGTDADAFENARKHSRIDSETQRERRDFLFDPVLSNMRGGIQFLKRLYRKTPHKLGDWSVTVDGNGRVVIPSTFNEQVTLFTDFKAHHDGLPAGTSPLIPYLTENDIDLTVDAANTALAKTAHLSFGTLSAASEEAKVNRDNTWNPVVDHIKGIAAYIMNLYSKNPKKAGQWGLIVDDSPRKPVERTAKVLPAAKKAISGLVIGSSVTNTGDTPVKIFKGSTALGISVTVNPTEEFGIVKGYSTITVSNESLTKTALIKYVVNR